MSNMKRSLLSILPFMMMASSGIGEPYSNIGLSENDIDFTPKQPPVPKGCKEYCFDVNGNYPNGSGSIAFKCIAINEKTAIKKFNRFKAGLGFS